jgi:hypothetical protein
MSDILFFPVPLNARVPQCAPQHGPPAFPPLLEQALLFGLFVAAALFWIAMIWWIVR